MSVQRNAPAWERLADREITELHLVPRPHSDRSVTGVKQPLRLGRCASRLSPLGCCCRVADQRGRLAEEKTSPEQPTSSIPVDV
jgi:hypothetical protein